VGELAAKLTTPEQSLLIIGNDWNSAIAYHSERKALALPFTAPPDMVRKILAQPAAYVGETPLGAIVFCPDTIQNYGASAGALQNFASGRKVLGNAGGCQILSPQR